MVGRETTNLFTGPRRRTGRDRCLLMGALFFRAGQKGREEPCQRGTLGTLWLLVLLHCIHIVGACFCVWVVVQEWEHVGPQGL